MDDQKKKKVLLAVLAVVGLGAGGYYFMGEKEANLAQQANTGQSVRRQRVVADTGSGRDKNVRRKRRTPTAVEKLAAKRVRPKAEQKKSERRKRGGRKAVKTKKKATTPAA